MKKRKNHTESCAFDNNGRACGGVVKRSRHRVFIPTSQVRVLSSLPYQFLEQLVALRQVCIRLYQSAPLSTPKQSINISRAPVPTKRGLMGSWDKVPRVLETLTYIAEAVCRSHIWLITKKVEFKSHLRNHVNTD